MGSEHRDELDALLDRALTSYASEQPRPQLERRVLRHVEAATARRPAWRLWWAWAVPALAGMALVVAPWRTQRTPAPPMFSETPPAVVIKQPQPEPVPAQAVVSSRRHRRAMSRAVTARVPLPEREQFPSAAPLTDQERALVQFVTQAPQEAREWIENRQGEIKPIELEPIRIEPLQAGGE